MEQNRTLFGIGFMLLFCTLAPLGDALANGFGHRGQLAFFWKVFNPLGNPHIFPGLGGLGLGPLPLLQSFLPQKNGAPGANPGAALGAANPRANAALTQQLNAAGLGANPFGLNAANLGEAQAALAQQLNAAAAAQAAAGQANNPAAALVGGPNALDQEMAGLDGADLMDDLPEELRAELLQSFGVSPSPNNVPHVDPTPTQHEARR